MRLLALLLPLCLAAVPPPDDTWRTIILRPITNVVYMPGSEVELFVIHKDGGTTLLPKLTYLRLDGWVGGGPILSHNMSFQVGNQDLESQWIDKNGLMHRVVTKCTRGEKPEKCLARHTKMVLLMMKQFPVAQIIR